MYTKKCPSVERNVSLKVPKENSLWSFERKTLHEQRIGRDKSHYGYLCTGNLHLMAINCGKYNEICQLHDGDALRAWKYIMHLKGLE